MAKFYAVKNGYKTGIFNSWEECQKQVMGYSNAEFKSFKTEKDALEYLGVSEQLSLFDEHSDNTAVAYTDGSYNIETGEFSYGVVMFANGREENFSKSFSDEELSQMRNVAGEIMGAMAAMQYCLDNNIENLDIYYDYEGVEKWCTGAWKTNKRGTIQYKAFYDGIKDKLAVSFNKVKGHSGDKYNEKADRLAKEALGFKV